MDEQQQVSAGSAGSPHSTDGSSNYAHDGKAKRGFKFDNYSIILIAVLALILIVTIQFRISLLSQYGFYEPDAFYHFSVIRAAVLHGFQVPKYLSISGWPSHSQVTEPNGLYWVTIIPYAVLQYAGVSYYSIERYSALVFGILDVLATYFLCKYITKDRAFGLLASAFIALSMGNAARTTATIYRGDSFISFFLIATFILMFEALRREGRQRVYFTVAAAFTLSLCNLVWNGGVFGVVVFLTALTIIILYGFMAMNKDFIKKSMYMLLALVIWFILVQLYTLAGFMTPQLLTDPPSLVFIVGFAVTIFVVKFMLDNIGSIPVLDFMKTYSGRMVTAVLYAILMIMVIWLLYPTLFYNLLFNSGYNINSGFASTIQELQPPTPSFLFASFGVTLFMTPMSLMLYASSVLSNSSGILILLFFIVGMFFLSLYLFMHVEDNKGDTKRMLSSGAPIKFSPNIPMLTLIGYLAVTTWLQINAVRFNSLLSIPLAIFTAYTVFWLLLKAKEHGRLALLCAGVVLALLLTVIYVYDIGFAAGIVQADNINPQFINALMWFKANSPNNSVVLTLWPDGSVVEGVSNRTSITDSVGSQLSNKSDAFALWLLNSSPDGAFLTSSISSYPNYILVRYPWFTESAGIFTEAGLNASLERYYGYAPFSTVFENRNATATVVTLDTSSSVGSPGSIESQTIIKNTSSGLSSESYIIANGGVSPYSYVVFYNVFNGAYSIVKQTQYNQTNGQMLVLTYSTVPRPQASFNVTGGYILEQGLAESNMVKLLFMCGSSQCAWNDSSVGTMSLVYVNSDTKIFKITYANQSRG